MAGNNQEASFEAIIGATGCGKTTELKKRLARRKRPRTLIWSPKETKDNYAALYPGSVRVRTAAEVLQILKKAGARGEFHIVFVPTLVQKADMDLFSTVCKMLLAVESVTLVVDEMHSVTTPSRAPDGWRKLVFMGRASGVHVFGLSQRPASVDKDFMGNLSAVWVGRLAYEEDQKTMAKVLGVPAADVARLNGYQCILRDMSSGKVQRLT